MLFACVHFYSKNAVFPIFFVSRALFLAFTYNFFLVPVAVNVIPPILFNYFFSNSLTACTMPFRMCGRAQVCKRDECRIERMNKKKSNFFHWFCFILYMLFSVRRFFSHQLFLFSPLIVLTCMYEHSYVFKLHFKLHSILYLNLQDFWVHANVVLCN